MELDSPTYQLPPVPASGITTPLANVGNTCWVNSCLKLLASHTYFDAMLLISDEYLKSNPIKIELRDQLRNIVSKLRQNVEPSSEDLKKFLAQFALSQNKPVDYKQADSNDLIQTICRQLGFPYEPPRTEEEHFSDENLTNTRFPRVVEDISYQEEKYQDVKDVHHKIISFTIPLTYNTGTQSIQETFEEKRTMDAAVKLPAVGQGTPVQYIGQGTRQQYRALINAPEIMNFYIERTNFNSTTFEMEKTYFPLLIDDKGRFQLNKHELYIKPDGSRGIKPDNQLTYEVIGAIVHQGSEEGGHYVFIEKYDGGYRRHSDRQVNNIKENEAIDEFKMGVFLRCRLVTNNS